MKPSRIIFCLTLTLIFSLTALQAQDQQLESTARYKIVKQNGVAFVGKILSQDAREILMDTEEVGQVFIPKHEIKEIIEIQEGSKAFTGELFSTRYFLTTNGFPVKKGDNYVQWNLFGPDFQFGVADHFGVGIMTSWVGIPIVGTAKYSRQLGKNVSGGIGMLAGTGSWAFPEYGLVLPFGFFTLGDRINNINFSAGYGALFIENSEWVIVNEPTDYSTNNIEERIYSDGEGRPLLSVAGMFRLNSKFSFVFDSFIMLAGKDKIVDRIENRWNEAAMKETYYKVTETQKSYSLVVLSPGLRFQASENSAFQFGFTGIRVEGEFVPAPIPMVQWFRKI